jgi:hypothetical protein
MYRKTQIAATLTAALTFTPASALAAAGPSFGAPVRIIASAPNVPSAVNGARQALTLRPGSGAGPALQLASPAHAVRTIQLAAPVAGFDNPSVAISRTGVVAATWDTSSTSGSAPTVVEMATGSFSAPPTTASQLSAAGAAVSGERAFVLPAGRAVIVWDESDAGGQPAVRAAIVVAGTTPSPLTLDSNASFVGAGIGAHGALIVIEHSQGGLVERTIAADGTVGPAQAFTAPAAVLAASAISGELGVLVDRAGDQLYSWTPLGAGQQLHAAWRSPAGRFTPVQSLGVTVALASDGPGIALNAAGSAVAVTEPQSAGPLTVRFAARLGRFVSARRVGAVGRFADMPAVSIDGAGRTLLAWIDSPPASRGTTTSRALAAIAHGTRFSPPRPLPMQAGLGQQYLSDAPLPAAAADGTATLVTYAGSSGARAIGQLAFLRR